MWLNDSGNLCYHKFSNFTGLNEQGEYDINYVHVNSLTDESGNGFNYTFGRQPANWTLARDVEENGVIKANLTKEDVFGNGSDDMGCQLNPCGAENGSNSICTNGDRIFRATIYRDEYEAIQFDTTDSYIQYFPDFWDPTFFSSIIDISGTTPKKPAVFRTYLLNIWAAFKAGIYSLSPIKSVEALNVDSDVIYIDSSEISQELNYYITYNDTNYYDHVVFKITTENGNEYYVRIERVSFNIMSEGQGNNKKVIASLYYPTDLSYEDYDVVVTKVKKDGSQEITIVDPVDMFDPFTGSGEMVNRDSHGGKELKKSLYSVDVDNDVDGMYFTVVQKGALNCENEVYDGTFSGSGRGIYYDLNNRQMKYDD